MTRLALMTMVLALLIMGSGGEALAKSQKNFTYKYGTIWSTAVRLIRVDNGYKITEKDKENGYMLFTFRGKGSVKHCAATMEIMSVKGPGGHPQIRVQLRIAHHPSYFEVQLLDALERKLIEEQGSPPPSTRPGKKDKPGSSKKDKPKK